MALILSGDTGPSFVQSAAMPSGAVLQTVNAAITATFTTFSTSFVDITGLSITITPRSSSSKILLLWSANGVSNGSGTGTPEGLIIITDGTNNYGVMDSSVINSNAYQTTPYPCYSSSQLISPATTSPITYKMRARTANASYGINISNYWNYTYCTSSITAMEIQG